MEASDKSRPEIREIVKRAVRKKCAFGCVVCGMPIYHYDHIEDYSAVKEHDENNLVLLCPNHHQDKTSKRLTADTVRRHLAKPANAVNGRTAGHRFSLSGEQALFVIGGNTYRTTLNAHRSHFSVVTLANNELMGVNYEDGFLLIDLTLHDATGSTLLSIRGSEMHVSTGAWDFRLEGTTIKVWSGDGKLGVDMSLLNDTIRIHKGLLVSKGLSLVIEPDYHTLYPMMAQFRGCSAIECNHGIFL